MLKQEIRLDMVEKLFQYTSSNELVEKVKEILKPKWEEKNKKEKKEYIRTIILCGILSSCVAISKDTVNIFVDIVQNINDVILALFGIIFTGYALFQALIGKEMLQRMINTTVKIGKEEKSKLQEANELFAGVMTLDFICIIINVVLIVIGKCIPSNTILFKTMWVNNLLAGLGIGVYFYVVALTLLEVKSFIYNMFQWFNLHAGTRLVELMNQKNNEE